MTYTYICLMAGQLKGGNPADQAQAAKVQTVLELKHDIIEQAKTLYTVIIKALVFPSISVRASQHIASYA